MRPTLKELAARAGVSAKTVSNVINGNSGRYSQETQDRILTLAAEVGYRPNMSARHLRHGKTGVIALVVPIIDNPYFAELAQEIIRAATTSEYTVLLDVTIGSKEREREILGRVASQFIDGIILDPIGDLADIGPEKVPVPVVLLGERHWDAPYDRVMIDNHVVASLATQHLIDLGRRRIAPVGITGTSNREVAGLRLEGFLKTMESAGHYVPRAYIEPVYYEHLDRRLGVLSMRQLLQEAEPPDAIFCFNDLIALGAMHEIMRAGLRIPEDIAVIGVDDLRESKYAFPPLSTVAPNKEEIARLAISLLGERIEGARTGPRKMDEAPVTLIARSSTIGAEYIELDGDYSTA